MADVPVPRPRVIGVINVTPDSFSVVGLFVSAEAAVSHGRRLWAEGADVLDVGGGSTRPGAIRPLQNGGLRARLGRRSP
jgi:dihydropteroate synthase